VRIENRENIFEKIELNLIYIFRDQGADTEVLFSVIFFLLYSFSLNRVFIAYGGFFIFVKILTVTAAVRLCDILSASFIRDCI
jgi:drug/metabolite transporter superfamily protein YnfA